jgi:hypothetical protein
MEEIINKLICTYENAVSDRICNNIIDKFENDNQQIIINNTQSLKINPIAINWTQIDTKISETISKHIPDYISVARETIKVFPYFSFQDDGYNICKFNKNRGNNNARTNFNWNNTLGVSILSVIIFINTVAEGGEVEFIQNGKIIKPKQFT